MYTIEFSRDNRRISLHRFLIDSIEMGNLLNVNFVELVQRAKLELISCQFASSLARFEKRKVQSVRAVRRCIEFNIETKNGFTLSL